MELKLACFVDSANPNTLRQRLVFLRALQGKLWFNLKPFFLPAASVFLGQQQDTGVLSDLLCISPHASFVRRCLAYTFSVYSARLKQNKASNTPQTWPYQLAARFSKAAGTAKQPTLKLLLARWAYAPFVGRICAPTKRARSSVIVAV